MLARLKFTIKSTLIYSLGNISIKLIGLILLPVYTDQLTTDQYGMWSILEITSQILVILFGLRLSTAMIRFYSSEKDKSQKAKIVFTAFLTSLVSLALFNFITHPFTSGFSNLFFGSDRFVQYFTFLIPWISFEILNRLILDLIRIKEKPGFYITATIIKFTVILILNIYFIVYQGMGISGIILGQLSGSVIFFIITLPFFVREMNWSFDPKIFRQMFNYGLPLIFSGLSTLLLTIGDRYLVKLLLNYHEVGIYSLSYKISNALKMIFVQSFQLGFLPIAFNMFNKPNANRFFSKIFTYYVFILFWSGLAISLFSKEIIMIFSSSESYYDAYLYVPFLVLAVCFFGIQNYFIIGLHYAKKTRRIALITSTVLIVHISSNIILIPVIGLYGAAISYILAGLLMTILNFIQAQKFYRISYEIKKVLVLVVLSIGLFLTTQFISNWALLLRLITKGSLILIYPVLLYYLGFYEPVELERIKGAWKKWNKPGKWKENLIKLKETDLSEQ